MIDPDLSKFKFIKNMTKINNLNNIIIMNYGVSNVKGKGNINKKFHPGAWKINENKKGNINIDTIDNICKNFNVSMMHIDVEGMEYKCLLGSKKTLNNVKYIMIELNNITKRNKEKNFLKKNNFIKINNPNISKENGNELFKKK